MIIFKKPQQCCGFFCTIFVNLTNYLKNGLKTLLFRKIFSKKQNFVETKNAEFIVQYNIVIATVLVRLRFFYTLNQEKGGIQCQM